MTAAGAMFLACTKKSNEKECDKNDPKSECYVQPKHTTVYTFDVSDMSVIHPDDQQVKQSCDSAQVEKVKLVVIDNNWDTESGARFTQIANRLESKKAISPKVSTEGTMTHERGIIPVADSLRLVALNIKLPVK